MNMSEFYSEFLFRYQTDAAPLKISTNAYCISGGVEYRNFINGIISLSELVRRKMNVSPETGDVFFFLCSTLIPIAMRLVGTSFESCKSKILSTY